MNKVSIHIAQPTELPEAVLLTSRAMINNPVVAAVFRGRQERMKVATKIAFERLPGQVYLAKDEGQIVGVMRLTQWPNCFPSSIQRLKLVPSALALKGSLLGLMKWQHVWAQHDPKEHHWHIASLAVLPERQRQGIGRQLVNHFCDFIDSRGSVGYLETDKKENVSYYEGFGFKIIGEAAILNEQSWFMWRPKSRPTAF